VAATSPRVDTHLHLSRWWPDLAHTGYRADLEYTVPGLLREMDANEIQYGIAIQIVETPDARSGLTESRSLAKESGGRLRPVVTVDPTKGSPAVRAALRLWEKEDGLAGIKLFPGYRPFYPHDRRLGPVYEFAHKRKLPVLVHQGDTLHKDGLIKYARPIELDEVVVRYSDVRFVLCHFGNPWIDEAAELVYKNENLYVDTSGLLPHPSSPFFARLTEQCKTRLLEAILTIGATDRVLYGSDWPLQELSQSVRLVAQLDLPLEDRRKILGENAVRLFGLPASPAPVPAGP
jgi:uncharacterized protein